LLKSLNAESYRLLRDLIRKTIVHEIVGHQLAFCTAAGPLVTRTDLLDILTLAGVSDVSLVDGTRVRAADLVAAPDLLGMISRIHYLISAHCPANYYENPIEMIAFAAEGEWPTHDEVHRGVLGVLRRNLLRSPVPLHTTDSSGEPLFEGFDLSISPARRYFIRRHADTFRETEAVEVNGEWITRDELVEQLQGVEAGTSDRQLVLQPGRAAAIYLPPRGCLISVKEDWYLACAFGVFKQTCPTATQPEPLVISGVKLTLRCDAGAQRVVMEDIGQDPVEVKLRNTTLGPLRLDA
jgi:hypothetical protein